MRSRRQIPDIRDFRLAAHRLAYELWAHHMNHNPANPEWANRDRFILSGGHGSMLLYSLLHLFGYGLTKEDLMNFRQVGSLTQDIRNTVTP